MMRNMLAGMVMVLLPCVAMAQAPALDSDQPIEITADSLEVLQEQQRAIFRGNVEAQQGNIDMNSDTMTVFYKGGGGAAMGSKISKIEATGNVFFAAPQETARGEQAIYDVDSEMIYLTGNVVLTRDKNVLKGSKLEYNLASGRSVLTGGVTTTTDGTKTQGGRVRGLFVPDNAK